MSEKEAVVLAYDELDPVENEQNKNDLPPVIFMQGLFFCRNIYQDAAKILCQKIGRKVYLLDLRGHGESPWPKDIDCFLMAEDVKQFILSKGLKKVCFVAHCLSSRIATIITIDQPELVEKLVFVDFFPYAAYNDLKRYRKEDKYFRFFKQIIDSLDCHIALEDARKLIQNKCQSYFFHEEDIALLLDIILKLLVKEENKFSVTFDAENLHDAFQNGKLCLSNYGICHREVLFLVGEKTKVHKDEDEDQMTTYFPNIKKVIMKDATHLLIFEKPEEFAEEVSKFLKKKDD